VKLEKHDLVIGWRADELGLTLTSPTRNVANPLGEGFLWGPRGAVINGIDREKTRKAPRERRLSAAGFATVHIMEEKHGRNDWQRNDDFPASIQNIVVFIPPFRKMAL
jgi:hypothetical protein